VSVVHATDRSRMMLYGSTTMGACYLVAAMCLRAAQAGEADKKQVRAPLPR
jgi:hypothetical protein